MKKKHAIHNENACDYLLQSGKFNDWVVTTAFYSAMQYLNYELFPLEIQDEQYDNFNIYYDSLCNYQGYTMINNRPSKHQSMINLVHSRLPNCNRFYRWLHNESSNARYSNYNVSNQMADTAKKYLNYIKSHLDKN